MDALSNLSKLLREAFANGAVGFTFRTGAHPLIYSAKGVKTYDYTACATHEDIEELLRRLTSSREMRQFRATGVVHFKGMFEGQIPVLGGAKLEGDSIHLELRKLAS